MIFFSAFEGKIKKVFRETRPLPPAAPILGGPERPVYVHWKLRFADAIQERQSAQGAAIPPEDYYFIARR